MTILFFGAAIVGGLAFYLGYFPGWFDSGEFASAIQFLGVPHPSGHPVYALMAKPITFFPIGSIAFRTALFSTCSIAVAAGSLACIGRTLFKVIYPNLSHATSTSLSLALMALLVFHPSIGLQSVRTEVYAPQLAITLIMVWLAMKGLLNDDFRWIAASLFIGGLAFAMQPLLAGGILSVIFVTACVGKRREIRTIASSVSLFGVGITGYLYLPLRASTHPVVNWDSPVTASSFWKAFTARDFQQYFHSPMSERAQSDWLSGDVTLLIPFMLLALAVIGTVALWRNARGLSVLFGGGFVASLGAWLLKDFYLRNPDSHAYVTLSIALALLLGAIGAHVVVERLRVRSSLRPLLSILLVVLSLLPPLLSTFPGFASQAGKEADTLSQHLDRMPPKAALFLTSDHWLFPIWYRTYVEGRRPDVAIVGTGLERASWYRDQLVTRYGQENRLEIWAERPRGTSQTRAGYLFGPLDADISHLQERFNESCRASREHDPFLIRSAICAQVVMTSVAPTDDKRNRRETTASVLETYLGRTPSLLQCDRTTSVFLPYPLHRDRFSQFLIEPARPESSLALLYLECGEMDLAEKLFASPTYASDLDTHLLHAAVLWRQENIPAALALLQPTLAKSRSEKGILALARATLSYHNGNARNALLDFQRAQRFLGKEDEAVASFMRVLEP